MNPMPKRIWQALLAAVFGWLAVGVGSTCALGAAGDQTAGGGKGDLGRTAEDEQGLGEAEGVLHDSSS